MRDNSELSTRMAELEKIKANVDMELRSLNVRNEELVRAQNSAKEHASKINNHQEASLEQVKSKKLLVLQRI